MARSIVLDSQTQPICLYLKYKFLQQIKFRIMLREVKNIQKHTSQTPLCKFWGGQLLGLTFYHKNLYFVINFNLLWLSIDIIACILAVTFAVPYYKSILSFFPYANHLPVPSIEPRARSCDISVMRHSWLHYGDSFTVPFLLTHSDWWWHPYSCTDSFWLVLLSMTPLDWYWLL